MDNSPQSAAYPDDEIDLFELVEGLWARRWLIAGITGIATALGLAAALLLPPSYQASAQVRPPDMSDLALVNESGIMELTAEQAFQRGLSELESQGVRRRVYKTLQAQQPATSDAERGADWSQFSQGISLAVPTVGKGINTKDYAVVSYTHGDANYAASAVNTLIGMANQSASETIQAELRQSIETRISLLRDQVRQAIELSARRDENSIKQLQEVDKLKRLRLQDRLAALRDKNRKLRQDQIAVRQEALEIARSLDIEDPITFSTDLNGEEGPLYLRGTRMLRAEIASLKTRKSDDLASEEVRELEEQLALLDRNREVELLRERKNNEPFVAGLDELRTELSRLEGFLALDYSNIRLMRPQEPAVPPEAPVKPRKSLIVAASLVAGGMLGILVALIVNATAQRRQGRDE